MMISSSISSVWRFLFVFVVTIGGCSWNPVCHSFGLLPPTIRISMGDSKSLQTDCLDYYDKRKKGNSIVVYYEEDVEYGYQVAACLFQQLVEQHTTTDDDDDEKLVRMWFPKLRLEGITQMKTLLSILLRSLLLKDESTSITLLTWPQVPAPCLQIQTTTTTTTTTKESIQTTNYDGEQAIEDTKEWVNTVLGGKQKLCPFTKSIDQGAIGLESMNVSSGPVQIQYIPHNEIDNDVGIIMNVVSVVLNGIVQLATEPESQVSTLLLICPYYNTRIEEFLQICDTIIEPCIQAINGNTIIGKAWFHPNYQTQLVYNTTTHQNTILPGHALPPTMVQTFVQQYYPSSSLSLQDITQLNNQIRQTPHATINLLRRTQLNAAKDMERNLPNPRPNAIYARNVIQLKKSS